MAEIGVPDENHRPNPKSLATFSHALAGIGCQAALRDSQQPVGKVMGEEMTGVESIMKIVTMDVKDRHI